MSVDEQDHLEKLMDRMEFNPNHTDIPTGPGNKLKGGTIGRVPLASAGSPS